MMNLTTFIDQVNNDPESLEFEDTIAIIDQYYQYTPSTFFNDCLLNETGVNEGSCKIFAFAQLHDLDQQQTLHCFGRFYREEVLQLPEGENHLNIRQFIKTGWKGIRFKENVLEEIQ